jgi:NADPH:quinone reductase-like Zn-dependent oxidoreductase
MYVPADTNPTVRPAPVAVPAPVQAPVSVPVPAQAPAPVLALAPAPAQARPSSRPTATSPMKAVVFHEYGAPEVIKMETAARPTPGDGEVLVKVRAASVNAADSHLMRGDPFVARPMYGGFRKPNVRGLGAEMAGEVEAVGRNVSQFRPGDEVFGDVSGSGFGGFAEYACVKASALALKPSNASFEQAATLAIAAVTALQGLRDYGQLRPGQRVLINGASGGVGTFAVQIAKAMGAEVTGVCSARKVDLVRSIGADHVIDYQREDFTRSGQRYDLILDTAARRWFTSNRRALTPRGIYVLAGGTTARFFQTMLLGPLVSKMGSQKLGTMGVKTSQKDLEQVKALVEAGKIAPVIDRRYRLSEVPDAIRYLEAGQARGKLIVTL